MKPLPSLTIPLTLCCGIVLCEAKTTKAHPQTRGDFFFWISSNEKQVAEVEGFPRSQSFRLLSGSDFLHECGLPEHARERDNSDGLLFK
jgi:hypothetical protein